MQGGWTTDVDHKALSPSLDFSLGAGHAREHGLNTFGPWGLSLGAQSYVTWAVHGRHEVRASYEFSATSQILLWNPRRPGLAHERPYAFLPLGPSTDSLILSIQADLGLGR